VAADDSPNIPSLQVGASSRWQFPADGAEDELDRRSAVDPARPRLKVRGPVVDQVTDAGARARVWPRRSWLSVASPASRNAHAKMRQIELDILAVTEFRQR
jgi:hypothetical protein